jgi:hypothetical protein
MFPPRVLRRQLSADNLALRYIHRASGAAFKRPHRCIQMLIDATATKRPFFPSSLHLLSVASGNITRVIMSNRDGSRSDYFVDVDFRFFWSISVSISISVLKFSRYRFRLLIIWSFLIFRSAELNLQRLLQWLKC